MPSLIPTRAASHKTTSITAISSSSSASSSLVIPSKPLKLHNRRHNIQIQTSQVIRRLLHQRSQATIASSIVPCQAITTATQHLFIYSTIYVMLLTTCMITGSLCFPKTTEKVVTSPWTIFPLSIIYGILLIWSWQPDTFSLILPGSIEEGFKNGFNPQFFPSLLGISTLFSRVITASSLWVHLLAVNVFAARAVLMDGTSFVSFVFL